MKDGRVVEEGVCAEVFGNPTNPYTQALLAAVPGRGLGRGAERRRRDRNACASSSLGLEAHGQLQLTRLLTVAAAELRVVGDACGRVTRDGHFSAKAKHCRVARNGNARHRERAAAVESQFLPGLHIAHCMAPAQGRGQAARGNVRTELPRAAQAHRRAGHVIGVSGAVQGGRATRFLEVARTQLVPGQAGVGFDGVGIAQRQVVAQFGCRPPRRAWRRCRARCRPRPP
ncbi:hypothetical protein G6F57_019224 [Rhizopus arrhizus]|nr:hypothetical protein G6F57_019224 [Rhizopus arrhizus]